MGLSHVGDESVVRLAHLYEFSNIIGMRSSHFYYSHLGPGPHLEKAQGHSYIVIQIPFCCADVETGSKHRGDEFFGSGFAIGAGESNHRNSESLPVVNRQFLKEAEGIVHFDETFVFPGTVEIHHRPFSPFGNGLCGIGVTIKNLSAKSEEKLTAGNGAAIRGHPVGAIHVKGIQIFYGNHRLALS